MLAPNDDLLTKLSISLGQLRADFSSDEEILSMFSQPRYWSELVASRPCFLVGGRGTGKTTTLRALGFRRQAQISGPDPTQWHLVGAYWRVESNVTSAFQGTRIDQDRWVALFSHYVNLRLCELVIEYLAWSKDLNLSATPLRFRNLATFCASLHLNGVASIEDLQSQISVEIARLEAGLNHDPTSLAEMPLSALGQPLKYLFAAVDQAALPDGVSFAFCIDEYENLLAYQQQIINTLVKHVGDSAYTFKIGVRSTTQGERSTLAIDQPLHDPADYTTIDIVQHLEDQSFMDFAASVCEKRLRTGLGWTGEIPSLFPALSLDEEARELGVDRLNDETREKLKLAGASTLEMTEFSDMGPLSQYMIRYWSRSQHQSEMDTLRDATHDTKAWADRLGNYGYASLFSIRSGLRGTRKFYTGWPVICHLASGNIRILLRIVHEALRIHVSEVGTIDAISPSHQTTAAVRIGESRLSELQAQTKRGSELTRLTLSLGRVFGGLAATPEGRTPEVNQFRVTFKSDTQIQSAQSLLDEGVAHGALESFAGNKEGSVTGGTKRPDYRLAPVFAPLFVFSHRRKRRLSLSDSEIVALSSNDAARSISRVLQRRQGTSDRATPLPDELLFYEEFFDEA